MRLSSFDASKEECRHLLLETLSWCVIHPGERCLLQTRDGEQTWSTMQRMVEMSEYTLPCANTLDVHLVPLHGGGFTICVTYKGHEPKDPPTTVRRVNHRYYGGKVFTDVETGPSIVGAAFGNIDCSSCCRVARVELGYQHGRCTHCGNQLYRSGET